MEALQEKNTLLGTIRDKFAQAERITNSVDWETDAQMKMVTHLSANTLTIFGHQPEFYIGDFSSFEKNIVVEDRLKIRQLFDALPSDPSSFEVEFRYQREDGRQVWVREVGEPMFDNTGRLTGFRRLPSHMIKIDQSFVRDMLEDVDDLAIVESIVGLAKTFKREVIAEGVETVAHGAALLQLGCELAQGYGIARPMPADDIPIWKADDSWQL